MTTLLIKDETLSGDIVREFNIEVPDAPLTVRELIEARVVAEVEHYNRKATEYFNGLVQPTDAERTLNGYRLREGRQVDPEKQVYVALDAFQKNAYFVLIDNRQAETLDEQVHLHPNSVVSFMRLVPLVGG